MAELIVPYAWPVVTRAEAKQQGLIKFFDGVQCKHGHVAQRYTGSWSCCACEYERWQRAKKPVGEPRKPKTRHLNRERLPLDGVVGRIPLTKGRIALVDAQDYDRVAGQNWFLVEAGRGKTEHAARHGSGTEPHIVLMHREILGLKPEDPDVDHWDGDGLNNRRGNLRPCTKAQNCCNRGVSKNNLSGYKGVRRSGTKWTARIRFKRKLKYLGIFPTAHDAASAYDDAAIELFGEFAWTNFKRGGPLNQSSKLEPVPTVHASKHV